MSLLSGALFCWLIWLTALAQLGRDQTDLHNRQHWGFTVCSWLVGLWLWSINPWAGALVIWCSLMTQVVSPVSEPWGRIGIKSLALAGGFGAAVMQMQSTAIPWALAMLHLCGVIAAVWVVIGERIKPNPALGSYVWDIPYTPWKIYDGEKQNRLRGGHGNPNHLDGVWALGFAAGAGLIHLGWWAAMPGCLLILATSLLHRRLTQGHAWFALTGLVLLGVSLPHWHGWFLSGLLLCGLTAYVQPWHWRTMASPASGRLNSWMTMLTIWWGQCWMIRLAGLGMGSWLHWALRVPMPSKRKGQNAIYTSAHNEFVQHVFEYGIIGAVLLLGFLGSSLSAALHAGPVGEAVLIVGVVCCGMASWNFPWTWMQQLPNLQAMRMHRLPAAKLIPGMALTAESTGLPITPGVPLRYERCRETGDLLIEEVSDKPNVLFVGSTTLLWWSWGVAVLVTVAGRG